VFHLSVAQHHHLVCDRCGTVAEAPADVLGAVAARVRREHGFLLDPGVTPLHGLCASCSRGE
jgi:Fur family ferric uptake transcriptional regulator